MGNGPGGRSSTTVHSTLREGKMLALEVGKKYRTRDGGIAEIIGYHPEESAGYKYSGIYFSTEEGYTEKINWHEDGQYYSGVEDEWDIVEEVVPETLVETTTATKFDGDKARIDLVDPDFLETVGKVLGFGMRKYAANNWRKGMDWSRVIAAAYRHLGAINRGEDIDPESGLPHTGHLACCVMFLDWYRDNRKEFDDRYSTTLGE